ncbi:TetR/AcrR family transcriptional regulator [Desulfospira joergensenii]|uniref:TetR/AcrR family transcriptional regulator n=1 Tax=Desulfospira joergensenii TaxID=53329 RepID=UPI0003B588FF|nr:TetR/AcrR family transcriptional regulator [Desulfospira joergensenii]
MRRKSAETRQEIIDAAYTLFYQKGFMRTGVDAIANAAGITKRTLYQHFGSKDELIGAVLEHQHQIALERIRRWADYMTGTPAQMVMALFEKLVQWAAETEWQGSGFTRAAMEFADLPGHPARKAARRQKQEIEMVLTKKFNGQGFDDAEKLVREVLLLIEGCQSLALIHEDLDYIDAARHAALILVRNYQSDI